MKDYFVYRLKYITKRRGTVESDGEMQIWTFLSVVSEIMNCLERMSRCASCRNNKHHFQNNKQNRTPHNRNNYYFQLLLWVTLYGNTEMFIRVSPIKYETSKMVSITDDVAGYNELNYIDELTAKIWVRNKEICPENPNQKWHLPNWLIGQLPKAYRS